MFSSGLTRAAAAADDDDDDAFFTSCLGHKFFRSYGSTHSKTICLKGPATHSQKITESILKENAISFMHIHLPFYLFTF